MTQLNLFGDSFEHSPNLNDIPSLERFQGALLLSTIGDALGWPTEFLKPSGGYSPPFELPVHNFVKWKKIVGGKWWGYEEEILPGAYSDDTQLALAVARCIADTGAFEPERFAYEELPLWLQYERGGGKSVKTAARKLVGKKASWIGNFYKQGDLDYRNAGANGAAMRNLPIALAGVKNESRIIRDSFLNAITTHGHPRAILGTILFSLAVNYALTTSTSISARVMISYLREHTSQIGKVVSLDENIVEWIHQWESYGNEKQLSFKNSFNKTYQEAIGFLESIEPYMNTDSKDYYAHVGALQPETKGSGLATVCAAIYLYLKYIDTPDVALTTAVNIFGSDTDTIGIFLGALLGAYHGTKAVPANLIDNVQDREYLLKTAKRLHTIASGKQQETVIVEQKTKRRDSYFKILAWEIGLHEMFWDAIEEGGIVVHPALGSGKITDKVKKPIKNRDDYVAKLISIQFDSGQSCTFHSRVQHNEKVSESLAEDIVYALQDQTSE